MSDLNIPATILQQLGGRRFVAMTGAKNFGTTGERTLTFRLPANVARSNINHVAIRLTPADLYEVTFSNLRGMTFTIVQCYDNVYATGLRDLFTLATGLDTHL